MYLIDTNIVLEVLLNRQNADDAQSFLRQVPGSRLHLSEFSLNSLGVILLKLGKPQKLLATLNDLFQSGGARLLRLRPSDIPDLVAACARFRLDFDDAYQYETARRFDLTIISFDGDFDRTDRGRKTPGQVLTGATP